MNKLNVAIGTIIVVVLLVVGIFIGQNLNGNNISSEELDEVEIEQEELASETIEETEQATEEASVRRPVPVVKTILESEGNDNTLRNEEWGFEIDIPQRWIDHGYYTKNETRIQVLDQLEFEADYYSVVADFNDWKAYELLIIARHTMAYYDKLNQYIMAGEDLGPIMHDFAARNILYKDENYVYTIHAIGHDSPNEFIGNNWQELYPEDLKTMVRKI